MSQRVLVRTLDWEEIRHFLVYRKHFIRGNELDEETFDAICDRKISNLSGTLMRELSVFIDGYLLAKPRGRK